MGYILGKKAKECICLNAGGKYDINNPKDNDAFQTTFQRSKNALNVMVIKNRRDEHFLT